MKLYATLGLRLSELVAKGLIEETGGSSLEHQPQMGGRMAGNMKNGFWTLMLLVVTIITWCTRDVTGQCEQQIPPRVQQIPPTNFGSSLYSIHDLAHSVRRTVGPDWSMIVYAEYNWPDVQRELKRAKQAKS
jgi:hypothetical protein